MKPNTVAFVITCEHASAAVPDRFVAPLQPYLVEQAQHRIYDAGAVEIARHLSKALGAPLFCGQYTRLWIDLNRSLHNRNLFGVPVRTMDPAVKQTIIDSYYRPYRAQVENWIQAQAARVAVVHLSVHSFTPNLHGQERLAEFALLYDPHHGNERRVSAAWLQRIRAAQLDWRCRANYPYKGVSDGFTRALRKRLGLRYCGIELEFNQRLPLQRDAEDYARILAETLLALELF